MDIEFDPTKDARNVRERGLSFGLGGVVLSNLVALIEDARRNYGERRLVAFGMADGRLLCMVHTWRGETMRVISLRRANRKEVQRWLGRSS